jgi:hypothetical protein
MSKRKPSTSEPKSKRNLAKVKAEADQVLAEHQAQQQRLAHEPELYEAVDLFRRAERFLEWPTQHPLRCRCLRSFHEKLLSAGKWLQEAGRLEAWGAIASEDFFQAYQADDRLRSHALYEWALQLFQDACSGELPFSTLAEAWDTESCRPAFRWIGLFVFELWKKGIYLDPQPEERPPIYWREERLYQVEGHDPVPVTDTEDNLLQAFIGYPVLDKPALANRSGIPAKQISTSLKRLRENHAGIFAKAINMPGKRGKGKGYRATVIDARPPEAKS